MSSLREFLTELSIDPRKFSAFIRDPNAVIQAAELDEHARRALAGSAAAMWDVLLGRPGATSDVTTASQVAAASPSRGSLTVIGTGIRTVGQLTVEAIAWIRESDVVLYLVADPIAEEVIRYLNPEGAMSLRGYYGEGTQRVQSYEAMIQHIMSCVRAGQKTCAAFYGHPGVFAFPSHESIRRARREGYEARMLPGISAEDCLFADLGVDPAVNGCQSFEATDFLVHERTIDPSSQLILWQIGVVGDWTYRTSGYDLQAFPLLISRLCEFYSPSQEAILYEGAMLPGLPPQIARVTLGSLKPDQVNAGSTLYVPPARPTKLNRSIATAMGVIK
jgi:precorrin-6B methylase 1